MINFLKKFVVKSKVLVLLTYLLICNIQTTVARAAVLLVIAIEFLIIPVTLSRIVTCSIWRLVAVPAA